VRTETAQPEALEDWSTRFQRGKCRVGAAALGDGANREFLADLGINALGVIRKRL
jgi:hypothetical protein